MFYFIIFKYFYLLVLWSYGPETDSHCSLSRDDQYDNRLL